MPDSNESEQRVRRGSARYLPAVSNTVIDAVADIVDGIPRKDLREVVLAALALTKGRAELGWLFADLICGLNGSDYLPLVAGLIQGGLSTGQGVSNPGKYDAICRALQADVQADAIVLMVVNGMMGSGFSVGVNTDADPAGMLRRLPEMLRGVANGIEAEQKGQS